MNVFSLALEITLRRESVELLEQLEQNFHELKSFLNQFKFQILNEMANINIYVYEYTLICVKPLFLLRFMCKRLERVVIKKII